MNADHLWSLTISVASTGPELTPKVTPYGAHARAIRQSRSREPFHGCSTATWRHHRTKRLASARLVRPMNARALQGEPVYELNLLPRNANELNSCVKRFAAMA